VTGFEDFGMPDGRSTFGRDINNARAVTVSSGLLVPNAFAYLWSGSTATMVSPPDCLSSDAGRITNTGMMTTGGIVQTNPSMTTRGFIVRNWIYSEIVGLPGASGVSFGGIADSGLISGRSNFGSSEKVACVWADGQAIDLNTLVAGPAVGLFDARTSSNGMIVANGLLPGGQPRVYLLTPVIGAAGDTNCDGVVSVADLLAVISAWGPCAGCRADVNGNGVVNVADLLLVISHWG